MPSTKMSIIGAFLLVAHLLPACLAQTDESVAASLAQVTRECNSKLTNIDSLEGFGEFMKHFRVLTSASSKPKRGLLNLDGKLRKCYDNKEQLFELEQLIESQDEGVCSQVYVDKLVEFHQRYVVKGGAKQVGSADDHQHAEAPSFPPVVRVNYAARLFSLYAHQVTFTCKSQLPNKIQAVEREQDCSSVLSSFLPPSALAPADSESSSSSSSSDEFSKFLRNFKRIEDFAIMGKQLSSVGPYFDVVVSREILDRIEKLKSQCRAREPYYSTLFAPIATLSQLGYDVLEPSVVDSDDLEGQQARLLKCWLATAQLCQGVLRTHVSLGQSSDNGDRSDGDDEAGDDDDDDDDSEQGDKLVKIKFGPVPDVTLASSTTPSSVPLLLLRVKDHVRQISRHIVDLVRAKASLKGKFKRRALNWARNFVEHHIDIDGQQSELAHAFIGALSREESEADSNVAFNGKKRNHGVFKPASIITDDADSITQGVSIFVHREVAMILSSAVAICLSAVFVWFTLYALVASLRASGVPEANGNFKADWRELRDKRMRKIEDQIKRKSWRDKMTVYRSPTN